MESLVMTPEGMGLEAKKALEKLARVQTSNAVVLALYGDLGSGKTAFVKGLARACGVSEEVTSPTFVIEKIYKINYPAFEHLIHIDAYRLEREDELSALGWLDIVKNPKNIIAVEWADKVGSLLPENSYRISFEFIDETTRRILWR